MLTFVPKSAKHMRYNFFPHCLFASFSHVCVPRTDGVDRTTMSHRLTKEELDEQFELFLKEVLLHCVQDAVVFMRWHATC